MSRKKTEKDKKVWISTLIQMVAIVVIVLLLRTFVIGTIYVKGSSMEPNFHHGDFLVINKLETRAASPRIMWNIRKISSNASLVCPEMKLICGTMAAAFIIYT